MNIIRDNVEKNPGFEIGKHSIIGGRRYQQDWGYYHTDYRDAVALICDGMGGMEGGERASRMSVELFAQDLHREKPSQIPEFLQAEAERMDRAVAGIRDRAGKSLKSGTTCVAAYCRQDLLYWLSVGDSRIYLIRGGRIDSLNRDHNYRLMLKEQLSSGSISRTFFDQEEKKPQAEALISFIGMGDVKIIDVTKEPVRLQAGDIILLCSDGVYKSLDDSQIYAMVRDNDIDLDIAADRLTAMAHRYGGRGQDNTTVILMKYRGNQGGNKDGSLLELHGKL